LTNTTANQVPLTITGASGQSADLLDITAFGGAAGNAFKVDQFLNAIAGGGITAAASLSSGTGVITTSGTNIVLRGGNAGVQVALQADATHNILLCQGVAAAVNNVQITNAATGTAPIIAATGADAAVGLTIQTRNASAPVTAVVLSATGDLSVNNGNVNVQGSLIGNGLFDRQNANPITLGGTNASAVLIGRAAGNIGFYGAAAVARAAAITPPAATASTNVTPFGFTTAAQADALVTAVRAIQLALANVGLTS
jgi:hypothetical protein